MTLKIQKYSDLTLTMTEVRRTVFNCVYLAIVDEVVDRKSVLI